MELIPEQLESGETRKSIRYTKEETLDFLNTMIEDLSDAKNTLEITSVVSFDDATEIMFHAHVVFKNIRDLKAVIDGRIL